MTVRRFLVVDDDEDVLFLLEANLTNLGQQVQATTDLDHAKKILRRDDIDVMIVDVSMPDQGGPQFVLDLRDEGIEPTVVYLLSALPADDIDRMAADLGVRGMPKPFTTSTLRVSLADVLD